MSGNRPFGEVAKAMMSRRRVLAGGLGTAALALLSGPGVAGASTSGTAVRSAGQGGGPGAVEPLIGFTPIPLGFGPQPNISPDYEYHVLIPWGTPIKAGAPDFSWPPTSAAQEQQIGIGHDGMWLFPDDGSNRSGILCINHEYGTNGHVLGKAAPESLEDVRVSQAAHGVSVVRIAEHGGKWALEYSPYNRRITGNTPVEFSGPAAGSAELENTAANEPAGTLNNCAHGYTPWGTYLTCEENFNGYFGAPSGAFTATPEQARYGLSENGFGYGWHRFDPRFDLSNPGYVNEQKRFGWVVEIDPKRPDAKPVKRTALGRIKHEGAEVAVGRGQRVVVYMGDDERFDYFYKFVSASNWKSMRARGISPLDEGTLYVARFNDDGTGDWLALTMENPDLASRFSGMDELLVNTRIASDIVGATPMDRPEWASVDDRNGDVYLALTNNSRRTIPDAANPQAPNNDGHIIRMQDAEQHTGTTFEWDIFLLCSETRGTDYAVTDPDGIYADDLGRLFIETDGGQPEGANNQLLVADTATGEIRRLFTGVSGDEITGFTHTPDKRTAFVNSQHPGNGDPTRTNFPAPTDGVTVPRDATIVITRKNGGIIGS